MERAIGAAAAATVADLHIVFEASDALAALAIVKFQTVGRDPLSSRPLNFIEQVNQTFTYLATCAALRQLLREHADAAPFVVNLGTAPGFDILSEDGTVAAEVFAATGPNSNDKLRKDLARVSASSAKYKYVFFSCPGEPRRQMPPLIEFADVRVMSLGICTHDKSPGSIEVTVPV